MRWSMSCPKRNASPALVESIRRIEEQADACAASLSLRTIHSNVALWALLVSGIRRTEDAIAKYGDNSQDFDFRLVNLSRIIPVAMRWIVELGKGPSRLAQRRWTSTLALKTDEAISVAAEYSAFLACFPMWHCNRYLAELRSPTLVRFTAPGTSRNRQVSAHLKGFRPTTGRWMGKRAEKPEMTEGVKKQFQFVLDTCRRKGLSRFVYANPWGLWFELLPEYQERVAGITRRPDSLSLGCYTLGEFKRFYAALLAVCAAHEFLCFMWAQRSQMYPLDSAVMVRSKDGWIDVLSTLSEVPPNQCRSAFNDLLLNPARTWDLHVHPLVSLDSSGLAIAIAPPFPLHSLPDENILRVCSQVRPSEFDVSTNEKQREMLTTLKERCSKFTVQGPISLPGSFPDIDVLIADESTSPVVIAELKWIRKTLRPVEFKDRDAEVAKGITQLATIREFLHANPVHLQLLGKISKPLTEFRNCCYLLVARDHWLWVEPSNGIAIVEFDAFVRALERAPELESAVRELLTYEWLPIEGRDFTVRYERATVNGVALESEVFYAAGS